MGEYKHIEAIPDNPLLWDVKVRGAKSLAQSLAQHRDAAALYKYLATLRLDAPISERLEDLEWRGVQRAPFNALCAELGLGRLSDLPHRWAEG